MPHTFDPQVIFDRLGGGSEADLANLLGTSKRAIARAKADGLGFVTADRWACHLGLHPSLIWPDWYVAIDDEHLDRLIATDPTILEPALPAAPPAIAPAVAWWALTAA